MTKECDDEQRRCKTCKNTGYKGRLGIFELLLMSNKIRDLIIKGVTSSKIREVAKEVGMRSLRDDGLEKVLAGTTTIDEVVRVTQAE